MSADDISFIERVRIYEGDELVFDGSDPATYIIIEAPVDLAKIEAAFMALADPDEDAS
jgi:hypothetical protein